MVKRILSLTMVLTIIFSFISVPYTAEATTYSGTCGTGVTWELDTDSGILTIGGTGDMTDYSSSYDIPWYNYRSKLR